MYPPDGKCWPAICVPISQRFGRRLYAKISEQLKAEIESVTENDCIAYVFDVVIRRTYEGYVTEKRTVYEQLEQILGTRLLPAPDEWDRQYKVDFCIPVGSKAIGIQIKPITYAQTPEIHKWQQWMRKSHAQFKKKCGGSVFIVFSVTERGGRKRIWNPDVIQAIQEEMKKLRD